MARKPCNCGGRRGGKRESASGGKRERFTLNTRNGKTLTFGSRLEAEAARVREGGGSIRSM